MTRRPSQWPMSAEYGMFPGSLNELSRACRRTWLVLHIDQGVCGPACAVLQLSRSHHCTRVPVMRTDDSSPELCPFGRSASDSVCWTGGRLTLTRDLSLSRGLCIPFRVSVDSSPSVDHGHGRRQNVDSISRYDGLPSGHRSGNSARPRLGEVAPESSLDVNWFGKLEDHSRAIAGP